MVIQRIKKVSIFCLAVISLGGIFLSFNLFNSYLISTLIPKEQTDHLGERFLQPEKTEISVSTSDAGTSVEPIRQDTPAPSQPAKEELPTKEAKQQINEAPPPQPTEIINVAQQSDGGVETVVVAEGGVATQSDFTRIASLSNSSPDPYGIKFSDETGKYADLEKTLKDYLNSILHWGSEVTALKEIIVRDAGETGWSGQYYGTYTKQSDGDIVSAMAYIILNVHYNESSSYFTDYMKLILAHEYGHHYTLYYKWVEGDSPAGERFPDSYYSIRPLSREDVTPLCDNGWESCEPEVIAEDYSYIYSGYNYHAFKDTYGLPSTPATEEWLNNIAENVKKTVAPNAVPTITMTAPANNSTVNGEITLSATASDDREVSKVVFSIDGTVLGEINTAPYQFILTTSNYSDGNHILKVEAFDGGGLSAEQTVNITIYNQVPDTENPVITIISPETDPYIWQNGNLTLAAQATDNQEVVKIEIYINDSLAAIENAASITRLWRQNSGQIGTYIIKFKAYDKTGNTGEKALQIEKQL